MHGPGPLDTNVVVLLCVQRHIHVLHRKESKYCAINRNFQESEDMSFISAFLKSMSIFFVLSIKYLVFLSL